VVDTTFETLPSREPLSVVNDDTYTRYVDTASALCLELLPLESLTVYFVVREELFVYLEEKLNSFDPAKSRLVAGLSICLYSNGVLLGGEKCESGLIGTVQPHLSWTENLTLRHNPGEYDDLNLVATCPVWQHVYLSLVAAYYNQYLDKRQHYSPSYFQDVLSNSGGGNV
jgi:hypothetical protein